MTQPVLRLRPLARGASQHVFVSAGRYESEWVYKTPAVVPSLFLHPVTWRLLEPTKPWKRVAFAVVERPASRLRVLDRLSVALVKRSRVAQFRQMCRILSDLERTDAASWLLPWSVVVTNAVLEDETGIESAYSGLLLRQRRADHFFDDFTGLERFDWQSLIHAQHELWRHGVGFVDTDEVLGPRNWSLLDGELRLGDTGSLNGDLRRVRYAVSDDVLDACQQRIPLCWPEQSDPRLDTYFEFIRREINAKRLQQLWRTASIGARRNA